MSTSDATPDAAGTEPQNMPAGDGNAPQASSDGQSWMDTLPSEAQDEIRRLRAESARYRGERNAERETISSLRQRVDAHDRSRIETIAAARLHDPRDFIERVSLDELRAEDGSIDESAVSAKINALVNERPHLATPQARDWGQGARGTRAASSASFGDALKSRQR